MVVIAKSRIGLIVIIFSAMLLRILWIVVGFVFLFAQIIKIHSHQKAYNSAFGTGRHEAEEASSSSELESQFFGAVKDELTLEILNGFDSVFENQFLNGPNGII